MVFTRVVVIQCCVFLICLNSVGAQKCNVRDFSRKSQPGICPEGQFCNITTNQCNKCGQCYDGFHNNIKNKKGDIENILRNLIEKYRKDLLKLQKLLESLLKNIKETETELKQLGTRSTQVGEKIKNVQEHIKKLQKDIKTLQDELEKIGDLKSIEDVVNELKTIKNSVETIQEQLSKLKFDTDDISSVDIDKFNNISNYLEDMKRRVPVLEKTSLNLALSLENDIDLLESLLTSFKGNHTNFTENVKANTKWIEKDLLWLFTILNNYENVSIDADTLERNASNATSIAQQTASTLNDLLKKHAEFEKHLNDLKSELEFYKELQELLERFKMLVEQIKEFEELWLRKLKLDMEATKFYNERKQLEMKQEQFEIKYKATLDGLWEDLKSVLEQYEDLANTKPINEILKEIEQMIKEIDEIREEIMSHCSSPTSAVQRT